MGKGLLIYQEVDGRETVIGRIRITPNSITFLLNDSEARLETRNMNDNIFYKISSNGTVLKSFYYRNRSFSFLKWKTSDEFPKILKCYVKYSRVYLTYKNSKIATSLPIAKKAYILNIQSSPAFPLVVLLASFFPFLSN
jgi:hypothetical protein